ncbi:MAG: hypothetical protein M1608_04455 [Candidatus Omnitrophica bacterium]|nr:hypothetical protein [Candidatus Omnitrophota bacterium]
MTCNGGYVGTHGMKAARQALDRCKVVLRLAWYAVMMIGVPGLDAADDTAKEAPQTGPVQTAYLDFKEAPFSFLNWNISVSRQSTPFRKEPDLSRTGMIRGTLEYGSHSTNGLSFIWDQPAGKLYLDLNRNQDFTDDPSGVFSSQNGQRGNIQTFSAVRVPLVFASGERNAVMDLNLYRFGSGCSAYAGLRSFWQAKITLAGRESQVGILENPGARLSTARSDRILVRPWDGRNKPFRADEVASVAVSFNPKLFVGNHAYALNRRAVVRDGKTQLELQFTEEQPALGELRITGDFVQRLVLEGGPYVVVLDKPVPVTKVPVGRYTQAAIRLDNNGTEAFRSPRSDGTKTIVISDQKPALLEGGGPLTNFVAVTRRGPLLQFSYQVRGAGGDVYELASMNRAKPPEFAVYQGGKKIDSGRFQFG